MLVSLSGYCHLCVSIRGGREADSIKKPEKEQMIVQEKNYVQKELEQQGLKETNGRKPE